MWQKLKNIYHRCSALAATAYYGFPGKKLRVIGVTGTDGKTTTTHLIHHLLTSVGKRTSMISSVYAEISGRKYATGFHVTSPNEWMIQKFLHEAVQAGEEYMVLEVTSHALDQHRVDWIDFIVGVLTNVSHEHLDYHHTYGDYLRTKEKLLNRAKVAIVNQDDESFQYINISIYENLVTYGLTEKAQVNPKNFPFTSPLPGEYNRYNCLAAIAIAKELGIADTMIREALKTFTGVKGRFEKIPNTKSLNIIIDFAHTPNAFAQVLPTARKQTKNKLIHLFGSAGLRDYTKRPIMGEQSAQFSDFIVLTEEDYRSENVDNIINQIAKGCRRKGAVEGDSKTFIQKKQHKPTFFRIPDRKTAIQFTFAKLAKPGDTVLLTGKGHEKSLCRGTVEYPWDEIKVVKEILLEK